MPPTTIPTTSTESSPTTTMVKLIFYDKSELSFYMYLKQNTQIDSTTEDEDCEESEEVSK